MDFDSIINFIVPWIIGIGGVWIMYKPLKEPLSGFFDFIKTPIVALIDMFRDKTEDVVEGSVTGDIFYE